MTDLVTSEAEERKDAKVNTQTDKSSSSSWKKRQEIAKKNAEKYQYVRFVEKKKITRKIRQARALLVELSTSGKGTDEAQASLNSLLDDMEYVQRFPLDEKYIALFPATPLSEESVVKQAEIKSKIKVRNQRREELDTRVNAKRLAGDTNTDEFFQSKDKKPVKSEKNDKRLTKNVTNDKQAISKNQLKPVSKHTDSTAQKKAIAASDFFRAPEPPKRVPVDRQKKTNHPSWSAKADPKLQGTLAAFEGKRVTFDEDSD